jgi:outer membrane protein assembly factor BamB
MERTGNNDGEGVVSPAESHSGKSVRSLRLWPAWMIAVATFVALVLTVTPSIANGPRFLIMIGGPLLGLLLISFWVLFLSRLKVLEKLAISLAALALPALAFAVSDPNEASRTALFIYGVPLAVLLVTLGFSIWKNRSGRVLRTAALMALGWAAFVPLRNDGFDGDYFPELTWRWTPDHEATLERLPFGEQEPQMEIQEPSWAAGQSWQQFRGPTGDGVVEDVLSQIDWQATPPQEVWRISIGPGWSSFTYHQGRLFTQEQRGELEYISCYSAEDGSLLWSHADASRFEEVVSGSGPRSTPSVSEGRVYAMGARALLTCLDEVTGSLIWQRDLAKELNLRVPQWGFSGSPTVIDGKVIVYAGGADDNGLLALSTETGEKVWGFPSTGENYTTARLLTLSGVDCLMFCDQSGVHALEPSSGSLQWSFKPSGWKSTPMVDPQKLGDASLLVALGDGVGMARLETVRNDDQWTIEEQWSTNQLRPSFNDSLIDGDLIFGFNQNIFSCIDAKTGRRIWHGGRFGFGQAVLLENLGVILLAAEKGDAIFLRASGENLDLIHRIPLLDDKTWNHPVVIGNRLFMRNGKVAACLQLSP